MRDVIYELPVELRHHFHVFGDASLDMYRRLEAACVLAQSGHAQPVTSKFDDPSFDRAGRILAGDCLALTGHEQHLITKFEDASFDTGGRWMAAWALATHDRERHVIDKFEDPTFDPNGRLEAGYALIQSGDRQYLITKFGDASFHFAGRLAAGLCLAMCGDNQYLMTKFEDPSFDPGGRRIATLALLASGQRQYVITKFEEASLDADGQWEAAHALIRSGDKQYLMTTFEDPSFHYAGRAASIAWLVLGGQEQYVVTKFEDASFDADGRWMAAWALKNRRRKQYLIAKSEDPCFDPDGRTLAVGVLSDVSDELIVDSIRRHGLSNALVIPLISSWAFTRLLILSRESRFVSALGGVEPGTHVPDAAFYGLIRLFMERQLPRKARGQVRTFFRQHLRFNDQESNEFMRDLVILRSNHPAADLRMRYRHEVAKRVVQHSVLCRILGSMPGMHENFFTSCQAELLLKLGQDPRYLFEPTRLSESYTFLWSRLRDICKVIRRGERSPTRLPPLVDVFGGAENYDDWFQEIAVAPSCPPEDCADWDAWIHAVAELSKDLPSFRRKLLRLYFVERLSYRKIARLLPEFQDRQLETAQRQVGRELRRVLAELQPKLRAYQDINPPRATTRQVEHFNDPPPHCNE